ncbi:MAG: hypothetical protein H0T66_07305 [Geodermatophilaceae bacterium]|nr:hypothetical protein [Geodermatophilaceae bacterium]
MAAPAAHPETLSLAGTWGKVAAYSAAIVSVVIGIASGPVLTAFTGDLLLR